MDSSLSSAIKDELGDEDKVKLKIEKKKTRYFVPTVPEPFQMTVREEGKRRERQLAKQFLNQGKGSESKVIYESILDETSAINTALERAPSESLVVILPESIGRAISLIEARKPVKNFVELPEGNFKSPKSPEELKTSIVH